MLDTALARRPNPWVSLILAKSLSSSASRLTPTEAARVSSRVAHQLLESLSKATDSFARLAWSKALAALARSVDRDEARARVWRGLEASSGCVSIY